MHDKLTKNPAVQHRPVGPTLDVKSLYLSFEDFIAFFLMLLIYFGGLCNYQDPNLPKINEVFLYARLKSDPNDLRVFHETSANSNKRTEVLEIHL